MNMRLCNMNLSWKLEFGKTRIPARSALAHLVMFNQALLSQNEQDAQRR
jgi:hypothetical protein